ncbi:MAG TPA: glycosyltransferase family 39 protein [Frankiaceae bacterium]|jgi:4-amino-4-deoxy-L-arabinose transferase-like glycosyltransferase|nr:glycosyltransferase family 39 protein [Frankiaceae bacterium]
MTITSPAPAPGLPYDRLTPRSSAPAGTGRLRRVVTGSPDDPRWARPALLSLLTATGLLYIVNLAASGFANAFYAAAVQAGSTSWKAFFFGSFDGGNAITVDKPPASLWITDISARIFGVNSWSILVPEALMGVASVGLLYMTVKRRFGAAAGLLAGAVLAVTPVATLMFRFNNPDALLVLLLVGSAYTMTRAMEKAETRWMVYTGVLIGFGFLTKMLQAFLVVPGFALVYLIAAPTTFWRRVRQTLYGGIAMVVAAGWWVAIVTLWPKSSRPYIGGSQDNSILNLIFGYNGFGRISGNETGSVGGGGGAGGTGMWGITGITRMFNSEIGGQIAWLIPTALIFLGGLLWMSRRMPRTDGRRAALILWGSWLLVTGLVFDFMGGIFHPYYTVALAPAIGALVGIGAVSLWKAHHLFTARAVLAAGIGAGAIWAYLLLQRTSSWHPWLRFAVLMVGLAVAGYVLVMPRLGRAITVAVATLAIVAGLAGPFAYSVATAATGKSGSIPSAGPSGQGGGFGGFGGRGGAGGPGGGGFPGAARQQQAAGGAGGFGGRIAGGGGGGLGGLLDASTPSAALKAALLANAKNFTWVAATVGSNNAAGLQLATGKAVMAIGGFNGTDPSPTLAQFEKWVSEGKIHYFIGSGSLGGGGFGGQSSSGASSQIAAWVQSHFKSTTIGGQTVYDLTTSSGA